MKKLIAVTALILLGVLNLGYYNAVEDAEVETIPFIKKHPTLQIKFYNIHANDGDTRKVERLTDEQRAWIIDYCKYRLGIETELKTQDDVERCSKM
jgi:hypothetical protein